MQMRMGPMMGGGMMQGQSMPGGRMGRFSPEDMSAFIDAHIAAVHAGLKPSAEQEKLWSPVEEAMRSLARLHLSHLQAVSQTRRMMSSDPVALPRSMAARMRQGADAVRNLADAATPLYATLDDAQKRRLQVLRRMGTRGVMGGVMNSGMMGPGGAMMRDESSDDDDDQGTNAATSLR
jgi:hypothetical protein